MKKTLILLLTLLGSNSFAQNEYGSLSSSSGNLYFGTSAGAAWNTVATPATSFRVDGGYAFDKLWAIELGTLGITQSGGTPNQSMQYYDASLKGAFPIASDISLLIQLGGAYGSPGTIGSPKSSSSDNSKYNLAGWNLLTAAGFQYSLTSKVALNLTDYYYYGGVNPQGNTNALLGGVSFNF